MQAGTLTAQTSNVGASAEKPMPRMPSKRSQSFLSMVTATLGSEEDQLTDMFLGKPALGPLPLIWPARDTRNLKCTPPHGGQLTQTKLNITTTPKTML